MASKYGALPVLFPMQYPEDVTILGNVAAKMQSKCIIVKEKLDVFRTYELISKNEHGAGHEAPRP